MNPEKERFRIQADFCKTMAHPIRLEIIDLLKEREMSVSQLVAAVGSKQANLSQHLAVLRNHGVVRATREGNSVTYALSNRKIVSACELVSEILVERAGAQRRVILSE